MKTIIRNFISVLRRFKMATLLNVLGLSVAFTAFMVIMMQVDYDSNFNRSHVNADRIYRIDLHSESEAQCIINRPLAEAFIRSSPHIQAGAIGNPFVGETFFSVERSGSKENYKELSTVVAPDFVKVFTFDMLEGQAEALYEPGKVLIPESIARRIWGSESAVSKMLEMQYGRCTVGGVYKDFPENSSVRNAIYTPMDAKENADNWGNWNYCLFVRLDDPASAEGLIENFIEHIDLKALGLKENIFGKENTLKLTPLEELHFITNVQYDPVEKSSRQTLAVLFAIAIVIVVIAGINFTNFSTALVPVRIKSINTQKVLGCSETMQRRALLSEGVFVGLLAYLVSLLFVYLLSVSPVKALVDADMSLSAHTMLVSVTLLIAVGVGLLAGLYPSYYITSFPPALVLKGSFGLSPAGRQLRNLLISVQFIASFALIIGAMFMYLQNHFMQHAPLGYDKEEVIISDMGGGIYQSKDALVNELKSFSGIEDITFANSLLSSGDQYMGWGRDYLDKNINFQCLPVDASFLKVMGVEIMEGRDFRKEDELTSGGAYIFNQKAKTMYEMALGTKIGDGEIVGFMPDVKFASFRTEVAPMAFFLWGTENWGQTPNWCYIKVKAGSDLRAAIKHVQASFKKLSPDYPFNVRFYDAVLNRLYEKEQNLSSLITLFSLMAVFISIVGVFGLVVFESEYRRKEIGVRKVLGSTTAEILIMFNKTYLRILLVCFVLAAPVAWYAVDRWLENFAYRTEIYGWVFVVAFFIVTIITVATVTFQNWRAANDNPVNSIKSE